MRSHADETGRAIEDRHLPQQVVATTCKRRHPIIKNNSMFLSHIFSLAIISSPFRLFLFLPLIRMAFQMKPPYSRKRFHRFVNRCKLFVQYCCGFFTQIDAQRIQANVYWVRCLILVDAARTVYAPAFLANHAGTRASFFYRQSAAMTDIAQEIICASYVPICKKRYVLLNFH